MSKLSSTIVATGLASGACLLAGQTFVAPTQSPVSSTSLSYLSTSPATDAGYSTSESGSSFPGTAVMGFAGVAAIAASAHRRTTGARTQRRAEPVTVAAAAAAAKAGAAAKAAAAAKGAAKVTGAVAGSAGSGSMAKAADESPGAEGEVDPELGGRRIMVQERGTPEYDKAMAQKRARNTRAWEKYTGRNPDGNFGDTSKAGTNGIVDAYDPFVSVQSGFTYEANMQGFETGEFNPAIQLGATEPLGYFDPLGFCVKGDEESFRKYRTAELKHGRVAMMGALGAVVQHYVKFPGFEKVPSGLDAVNVEPGSYGAIALILVSGALELGVWTESDDKEPGNFGDPAGLGMYTEEMRNRELNNGRAAMFAVMGIIAAELLTGKDAIEQLGLK